MKTEASQATKLRRTAWCVLICGLSMAVACVVLAGASLYLRGVSERYWRAEQVEPFKQDCMSALASSPDVAERFRRFCDHFDIATETAQEYMLFLAFFSFVFSGLGIGQALFARMVLKQIKRK